MKSKKYQNMKKLLLLTFLISCNLFAIGQENAPPKLSEMADTIIIPTITWLNTPIKFYPKCHPQGSKYITDTMVYIVDDNGEPWLIEKRTIESTSNWYNNGSPAAIWWKIKKYFGVGKECPCMIGTKHTVTQYK